jgi:hypothetical protein
MEEGMITSTESRKVAAFDRATLKEGVIAGVIGAAVLAGWFLVLDMVVGRLFFTPAALGSALFLGAEGAAAVRITAGTVLGFTLVHLVLFTIAGVIFAAAAAGAEAQRGLLMAIVLFFVATLTLVVGLMALIASWVLVELTWWGIAIGNLLAAAAMAVYLWNRHPRLAADLSRAEESAAAQDGTAGPGWEGPGPDRPDAGTHGEEPHRGQPRRSGSGGGEPHYRPRGPSTPEGGKPVD